jgi:outer membrane receptor for ferrienterochelin and colicins
MKYLFIPIFSIITLNAAAQTQPSTDKTLTEVVVTGQLKNQTLKTAIHQVRIITKDRIVKQGASNLQAVLKNELNISFNQDAATGGSDITMMGVKGQNVKILIDGLPMVGRQGTSNEININQIDINTIERIEIVEGPMAVVYGADALAGVINIITKKNNTKKLQIHANIQEETIGNEYGSNTGIHNQNIGADWKYKNIEIGGNVTHNYFGGWKDTAVDRELVWHKKDQRMGSAYLGYRKNKFNIRYSFNGLDEAITNPGNYSKFPNPISGDYLAYDQQYLTKRIMQQLQTGYTFNNKANVQLQTVYTNYNREIASSVLSKNTEKLATDAGEGRQANVNFNGITARGIFNYSFNNNFAIQQGAELNNEVGEGERLNSGKNSVTDFALFTTAEIKIGKKINIRPGIRFINNSVYKAPPAILSINTKFILTKNIDLRVAYANGFRAPSIRELYFNFFDANHQIFGNPNLKAETSNSINSSLNFTKRTKNNMDINSSVNVFYSKIKNLIDFAISPYNANDYLYTNIYTSKTAGAYWNNSVKYKNWNTSLGIAYTGFFNELSETDKALPSMQWASEFNSNIGYSFSKIGLDLNVFYKLYGKKPFYALNSSQVVAQVFQSAYQLADFTAIKKLEHFSITAGVKNIFDTKRISSALSNGGVHNTNNTRNIATGRSLFFSLNYNW